MRLFLWAFAPVFSAAESSEVVNVARGQPCEVNFLSIQTSCDALVDGNLSTPLPEVKVVDEKGNISSTVTNMLYRIQLRTPTFVLQIVVWFVPSAQGIDADLEALEVQWTGKNPKDQHQLLSSAPAYLQLLSDRNIVRLAIRMHAEAETVIVGFTKPQMESCPQLTEVAVMAKANNEENSNELETPVEEIPRSLFQLQRSSKESQEQESPALTRASMSRSRNTSGHQAFDGSRVVTVKVSWVPGHATELVKQRLVNSGGVQVAKASDLDNKHKNAEAMAQHSLPTVPFVPFVKSPPSLTSEPDHPVDAPSALTSPQVVINDKVAEAAHAVVATPVTDAVQQPKHDAEQKIGALQLQRSTHAPPTSASSVARSAFPTAPTLKPRKSAVLHQAKKEEAESESELSNVTAGSSSQAITATYPDPSRRRRLHKTKNEEAELYDVKVGSSSQVPVLTGAEDDAPVRYKAPKFLARREAQDSAFSGASEGPHVFSVGIIAFAMVFAVMVMPVVRLCTSKVEEPNDYETVRPNVEISHGNNAAEPPSPRLEPCAEPSESEPDAEPIGCACSPEPGDAQALQKLALPFTEAFTGLPIVTAVPTKAPPAPPKPEEARSVVLLFASPLVFRHPAQGPTPLPQLQFTREWQALTRACRTESGSPLPAVVPFLATAENLQGAVAGTLSLKAEVLHLSMHSKDNCLVLDNGSCTAHFLECRALRGLLECTGSDPPRLAFLGACNSAQIGHEFVHAGVPHVICTTRDVGDNAASLFARAFYRHLFRGHTVMAAFRAARGAVGASPDVAPAEANSYILLPENEDHGTVLFQTTPRRASQPLRDSPDSEGEAGPSGSSDGKESDAGGSDSEEGSPLLIQKPRAEIMKSVPQIRRSPSRISPEQREQLAFEQNLQALAAPPEDFMGRTLDVWAVLQHLSRRRVTIICGESGTCHGIGKTAILEAVARSMLLQSQVRCVRADLRSLTDTRIAESPASWASRVVQALKHQGMSSGNRCRGARAPRCRAPSNTCLFGNDSGTIPEVLELIEVLRTFGEGVDRLVLLLDESDHLIQQRHFQEALTILLQGCGKLHVLLTTQQPMVGDLGRFKVVHQMVKPLEPQAAARLFLQRCRRPLRWDELAAPSAARAGNVIITKENEAEVISAVARHSSVSSLAGNPKLIVEQASRVGPSLRTLADLVPEMVIADKIQAHPENCLGEEEGHIT